MGINGLTKSGRVKLKKKEEHVEFPNIHEAFYVKKNVDEKT